MRDELLDNALRVKMGIKKIVLGDNRMKTTLLMMITAYLFSLAVRMIWVYQFGDVPDFHWNGQLMINTNDGYFWASGVQQAVEGMHQYNPRIPDWLHYGVVFFSVAAVKLLPFSLDTIILYMPTVIASLVVIPIILIGRLYNAAFLGFLAALIGSVAWSYYNRTMTGYYDTDMFSAMAPMFILYFLLRTVEKENLNSAFASALTIFVYPFLYDAGLSLVYAMGLLYMLYMVLFHRRDAFTYQSIILISVALMGLDWMIKLPLILMFYFLFRRFAFEQQKLMVVSALAVLLFLYTGNVFALIWAKFSVYFFRGVASEGLRFFEVAQTVREAGTIPFEVMANRISGSTLGVISALIGYILLVVRHRPFILALPLIGIGIFSLWGGLRFTVFAVPIAAVSAVYLFFFIASHLRSKAAIYAVVSLLSAAMLYPNITHIIGYQVPTVFTAKEVRVLDNLKHTGSDSDYVITWWDYGYPIWYYANKNTLIDGGKHNHDNFIVSEILSTDSQIEAARLSRIAVEEYVANGYRVVTDTLFRNGQNDQVDVGEYLEQLRYGDIELPEKTRDVYLYLPLRMLDIFPTVTVFSNIDLASGEKGQPPFFYKTSDIRDEGAHVNLGGGMRLDKQRGMLLLGKESVPVKHFIATEYTPQGILNKQVQTLHYNGAVSLVLMRSYNTFLVLDEKMLNSTFIQMFVLENYDHDLFEPVELTPLAKVYRLKQ
jgi:undecaprenyl-diphosphooligosaccharide--protein glycosyltransferase